MPQRDADRAVDLLGLLPEELELFLRGLGQPPYRARQLFSWLHRGAGFAEMTDLPGPLRERLGQLAFAGALEIADRQAASDGTEKFALRTRDGHLIESVFIPARERVTVCVSSQIGCAIGCSFCATGQQGLVRSLTAGEIVAQVVRLQHAHAPARVSNVVFMGMGEPLANYDAVLRAVRLLNHPQGLNIAARHIAVSTCGLPEQILKLAGAGLQVALAISLHGATDEVRTQLVPLNSRFPIAEVMAAARGYAGATHRKVAFEYVVVPGLNDTPDQARRLAHLVRGLPAMVNVIPRNPGVGQVPRSPAATGMAAGGLATLACLDPGTNERAARAFAERLRALGVEVAVRRSRGAEVLGACGQLRARLEGTQPSD